jgi:hypothetical protein
MVNDLRNPDAVPSEPADAWTVAKPMAVVVRALALAVVAIGVGVSVSQLLADEDAFPPVRIFSGK